VLIPTIGKTTGQKDFIFDKSYFSLSGNYQLRWIASKAQQRHYVLPDLYCGSCSFTIHMLNDYFWRARTVHTSIRLMDRLEDQKRAPATRIWRGIVELLRDAAEEIYIYNRIDFICILHQLYINQFPRFNAMFFSRSTILYTHIYIYIY